MNIQTIRRKKHIIILVALLFLLLINILISLKTFAASPNNVTVTSDVYFCLPNGSEINFENGQGLNTLTSDNSTGEWYWGFDSYKFRVQDANLTINTFFRHNQLVFTVSALDGTSTTNIYVGDLGKPTSASGANTWNYNPTTKTVTLTVVHSSPIVITLDWMVGPLVFLPLYSMWPLLGVVFIALLGLFIVSIVVGQADVMIFLLALTVALMAVVALIVIGFVDTII